MSFIEKYVEGGDLKKMIPHFEMNRPVAPSNGLADVGLELEMEGRGLPSAGAVAGLIAPKSNSTWITHNDGSLRGESLEYVLERPCFGNEIEHMVGGLYTYFGRTRFNLSNRCSTHVHVNIGGYKVNELTSVILLWSIFEDMLVRWCGEQRTTNHFCLGFKDTNATVDAWDRGLKDGDFNFTEGMKYTALNLRPIFERGSVEFRTMRAEEKPDNIIEWAKFCLALVRFAKQNYKNPYDIAHALSERGGLEMFANICESGGISGDFFDGVIGLPGNENFNILSVENFRRTQKLALGYPWYDWIPEIDKVHVPNPFGRGVPEAPQPARPRAAPQPRGRRNDFLEPDEDDVGPAAFNMDQILGQNQDDPPQPDEGLVQRAQQILANGRAEAAGRNQNLGELLQQAENQLRMNPLQQRVRIAEVLQVNDPWFNPPVVDPIAPPPQERIRIRPGPAPFPDHRLDPEDPGF
ncbi:amidoligase family protein [Patescibacteria group bacterium]|nr:amidoligase family protein [Patescibacteria group bacterium]